MKTSKLHIVLVLFLFGILLQANDQIGDSLAFSKESKQTLYISPNTLVSGTFNVVFSNKKTVKSIVLVAKESSSLLKSKIQNPKIQKFQCVYLLPDTHGFNFDSSMLYGRVPNLLDNASLNCIKFVPLSRTVEKKQVKTLCVGNTNPTLYVFSLHQSKNVSTEVFSLESHLYTSDIFSRPPPSFLVVSC
ncbi:MAG: hypothetical protein H6604_02190 [Flavobacteriales bacterium]|nr:hypothetical protein [Flavobacteriales bacterium]